MVEQQHEFGGNVVASIARYDEGTTPLARGSYLYSWVRMKPNSQVHFNELLAYTVFMVPGDTVASIAIEGSDEQLGTGDSAEIAGRPLSLQSGNVPAVLLVAASVVRNDLGHGIRLTRSGEHYCVRKPWGQELWINGEHPGHCLKIIEIRAGYRCSLQYHRRKEETNLILRGRARLIYQKDKTVELDEVKQEHLGSVDISPVSSIHVRPFTLHRLEAISDLYLCEASTPDLDDVVRIQDDSRRGDGRIHSEHSC